MNDPYNEDISWLINDAPAALGERGSTQDPFSGSGRTLADNWSFIERSHAAIGAVARARRLETRWKRLSPRQQNVLCAYYTARKVVPVTGALAAFGVYARVALLVAGEARQELERALSDQYNKRHVPRVTAARRAARQAVSDAHREWERYVDEELSRWIEQESLE